MAGENLVPVVVGVGDIKNESRRLEDAVEPAYLMINAIYKAISDTGLSPDSCMKLQSCIDSVDVVATWTWPYSDLPTLLSDKLNIQPRHKLYSHHAGNAPAKLFDDAARRLSQGKSQIAVVTGGEALASCMFYLYILREFFVEILRQLGGSECLRTGREASPIKLDRTGSKRVRSVPAKGIRERRK